MHRTTLQIAFTALAAVTLTGAACQRSNTPELKPDYPHAKRGDVVDDYNGTRVADPYRWLEDPDAPETRVWIDAQNKLTRSILDQVTEKDHLSKRLTELWNFERYTVPERHGDSLLYFHNDGLQNQSVLYQINAGDDTPKLLLDPNRISVESLAE